MLIAIIAVIVIPTLVWAFLLYQMIKSRRHRNQDPLPPITVTDPIARVRTLVSYINSRVSGRRRDRDERAGTPVPLPGTESGEAAVVERRTIWDVLRFISGPLPLSLSLHIAVLLAILWGVHFEQGRNLITVNFQTGGGGGGRTQQLKPLDVPEMPMPAMAMPLPIERPIVAQHSTQAISEATHYMRSVAGGGIGIGRGGGIGSGYGRGIGAGFGGFIAGLRRSGLDVALVIDGTGSMKRIIDDVKGKMRLLILAIHRLVPATRMGIVVFGGRGEPIQVQPLTISPDVLLNFLNNIQAQNGGAWQEDTLGAVRTAVDRLAWRPLAKKVIILVGDTPPFDEDKEPTLDEVRKLRAENGIFNTVDVTVEEHKRFLQEYYREIGMKPPKDDQMPSFYFETQRAYQDMAASGGGQWRSLTRDEQINQQVLILAFGSQWQTEVAAFGRGLVTGHAQSDP
ncbi:MAG: VWA domain-containing protein [Deltaproteobacteria bacterium]|nr:VWA domain-containing protein [Deltaproteobacteria bacterium]